MREIFRCSAVENYSVSHNGSSLPEYRLYVHPNKPIQTKYVESRKMIKYHVFVVIRSRPFDKNDCVLFMKSTFSVAGVLCDFIKGKEKLELKRKVKNESISQSVKTH